MKISIAMATYNGSKYLQEQLDSFTKQRLLPDEVVVCDDASSDDTVKILYNFQRTAPFPIRIFINRITLGYSQNFSRVLSLCAGDLICLSDQDDVWFENKIFTIAKMADKMNEIQVFMNDAELTLADLTPTGLTKIGQMKAVGISNDYFVMGSCISIRKNFLQYLLPIPLGFPSHDDWLILFSAGLNRRKIIYEPLQYYRRHNNNCSQIITNQINKLCKVDKYLYSLKRFPTLNAIEDIQSSLIQLTISVKHAENWAEKNKDPSLEIYLKRLMMSLRIKKMAYIARLNIIKKPRIFRIFYGIHLLKNGYYKEFHGLTTLVRDLIS